MKILTLTLENKVVWRELPFNVAGFVSFYYYGEDNELCWSGMCMPTIDEETLTAIKEAKKNITINMLSDDSNNVLKMYNLSIISQAYKRKFLFTIRAVEQAVIKGKEIRKRTDWDNVPEEFGFMKENPWHGKFHMDVSDVGIRKSVDMMRRAIGEFFYYGGYVSGMQTPSSLSTYFDQCIANNELVQWDLPEPKWNVDISRLPRNFCGTYCYIQKVGDAVIFRIFGLYSKGFFEEIRIMRDENGVTVMTNKGIGWLYSQPSFLYTNNISSMPIIGMDDDIMDSRYQYYAPFVEEMDMDDGDEEIWKDGKYSATFAVLAALFPGFENIQKTWAGTALLDEILYKIECYDCSFQKFLKMQFGECDPDAESFAKMVGIPQWMLNELLDISEDSEESEFFLKEKGIKRIKDVVDYDYLSHMDKDTFRQLINVSAFEDRNEVLRVLVESYGTANFKHFLKYAWEISYASTALYADYIRMARTMAADYPQFVWNVGKREEEICQAHDQIVELYNIHSNQIRAKKIQEGFEKESPKWEKYLFSDEKYAIVLPKQPEDIVNEGLALHHCVKSYLERVCEGKTTILFIRKADEPDVPFYTLEVKDGQIRQCHGLCNCNVTEELDAFLREFCKKTETEYANPDGILAVA